MELLEILLCSKALENIGANKINKIEVAVLSIKEKNIQILTHFKPLSKFLFSNSSETIQVQDKLIPDVAIVIASVYIDITKLNIPIAS